MSQPAPPRQGPILIVDDDDATVTHEADRPEFKFIVAVSDGWPMVLSNLKSPLETGQVVLTNS